VYTVKYIRISTDTLRRVFHILTVVPVPYTFVSVNRRNNEARTPHCETDTNVSVEPVALKYGKLIIKYPLIYGYFACIL